MKTVCLVLGCLILQLPHVTTVLYIRRMYRLVNLSESLGLYWRRCHSSSVHKSAQIL